MNITLNSVFKLAFQIFGYDFVFQLDDDDNNSQKRHFSLQKRLRCKLRNILHHRGSVFVAGTSLHLKEDKQKSNKLNAGNEKQDGIELIQIGFDRRGMDHGGMSDSKDGGTDAGKNCGIDDDYVLTTALDYFPYRPSNTMDCSN